MTEPETMDGEVWLRFPGADPIYQVSNVGRVWSVPRKVIDTRGRRQSKGGVILAPIRDSDGYIKATVTVAGRQRAMPVHRAVCEAFHGPPPSESHVVAHGDGDPANNRAGNLRWATHSENALDTVRHGRNPWRRKTHCKQGHAYTGENLLVNSRGHRRCQICTSAAQKRADAKRPSGYARSKGKL